MTVTVDVYKGVQKLGSGTATNASASITAYTAAVAGNSPAGKNVQVTVTSGSNNVGMTINTRILTDGTTSLTLNDKIYAS